VVQLVSKRTYRKNQLFAYYKTGVFPIVSKGATDIK
jgi:hypothetical protein